jgi:hypothetical protein
VQRPHGRLVGEVDFGWSAQRTVGEFDERIGYGRLVLPGEDAAEMPYREKLREDALRREALAVVHRGRPDITILAPIAQRIRWT